MIKGGRRERGREGGRKAELGPQNCVMQSGERGGERGGLVSTKENADTVKLR